MAALLADYRLVFVGPTAGRTAVGDYSDDFIKAIRPHVGEVVEVRTRGPLADGVADIRRYRRMVADAVRERPGRVLVHAELAAGETGAFWAIAGLKGLPVAATYHDPPQGVWWPAGVKGLARNRLVFHGVHYPLRPVSAAVEGAVNGRRLLFALTETGWQSIERRYPGSRTVHVPHIVRDRPAIKPVQDRRTAVGFFGHVYRGKGFHLVTRMRRLLPRDIAIRIAGRGTESLPRVDGIEVVGPVEGASEDAFFESIQVVMVPYGKRHWYDDTYPASGVVAHACAYRTPVVCTGYGSLGELDEKTGAVVVPTDTTKPVRMATDLADAAAALLNDEARLTELGEYSDKTRHARSGARTAEAFAAAWSQLLIRRDV